MKHILPQIIWWIACLAAINALRGVPFAERDQPITMEVASEIAIEELRAVDPDRYEDYVVLNAAYSKSGELGLEPRWIVLCDDIDRTGLREAVAMDIDSETGRVLRIRKGLRRIAKR